MAKFIETERAALMYCDEQVDGAGRRLASPGVDLEHISTYLDSTGSVSGLIRFDRCDSRIREFTPLGERLLFDRWPYGS